MDTIERINKTNNNRNNTRTAFNDTNCSGNVIKRFKMQEDAKRNNQNNANNNNVEIEMDFDNDFNISSINAGFEKELTKEVLVDFSDKTRNVDKAYLNYEFNNDSDMINYINKLKPYIDNASSRWGVSPNLIAAIISQESSGNTNPEADNAMQINFEMNKDTIFNVFDYENNRMQKIVLTNNKDNPNYKDCIKYNINEINDKDNPEPAIIAGTAILANCANERAYNIPLAIVQYNLGGDNVESLLIETRNREGYSSTLDASYDQTNLSFNKYTKKIATSDGRYGDQTYLSNVMKFINVYNNGEYDPVITFKKYYNLVDTYQNKRIAILPENMK